MSNFDKFTLNLNPNTELIYKWYQLWKEKNWVERFIFLWISFNALYEATTIADRDSSAWKEFIDKQFVKEVWERVKKSIEIEGFLNCLKERAVYDSYWVMVWDWWLYDMQKNTLYKNWDFWNDLQEYIWVIYRIRNNLFHWWKRWDDSDVDLIQKANESFLIFLKELYGFHD